MKKYRVLTTESFLEDYKKLPKTDKVRIDKIREQLKSNPYVGKPLGYEFFREKRVGSKRLYYLIFEKYVVVLVVAYSGKKAQQSTIDAIKKAYETYKKEIEDRFGD